LFIFAQQATLWSAYPSFLPRYNYINGTPASSSKSAQKLEPDIVILKPSLEYPIDADMHGISPTPSIPMADASHLYMHLLLPISKAAVYFFPGMGSVAFGGGERFSI
jgi:hypothetical protein